MIKCFEYINAKNEYAVRIVNVVHESELEYRGFDYNKLSQSEQAMVTAVYPNNYAATPIKAAATKMTPADYEKLGIPYEMFTKAYRIFKKKNIVK